MKNLIFHDPNPSRHQSILQAIKKQVIAEYELDLRQAKGWWKYLIKWKITLITQTRYRGILLQGAATKLP